VEEAVALKEMELSGDRLCGSGVMRDEPKDGENSLRGLNLGDDE
jgi:hypothetical protein